MSAFIWTEESKAVLRDATRKLLFDFEKVAIVVRSQFGSCEVTANDCRVLYAEEYMSQPILEIESENTTFDIEDSMTFDEIMDVVEIRNERSEKRKQKIFSRVLASLGAIPAAHLHEDSTEMETIKSNMADKKLIKQREQERKEKHAAEHDEMCWIVKEREKLRTRHLPGSIDSEGDFLENFLPFMPKYQRKYIFLSFHRLKYSALYNILWFSSSIIVPQLANI